MRSTEPTINSGLNPSTNPARLDNATAEPLFRSFQGYERVYCGVTGRGKAPVAGAFNTAEPIVYATSLAIPLATSSCTGITLVPSESLCTLSCTR